MNERDEITEQVREMARSWTRFMADMDAVRGAWTAGVVQGCEEATAAAHGPDTRLPFDVAWECAHVERAWRADADVSREASAKEAEYHAGMAEEMDALREDRNRAWKAAEGLKAEAERLRGEANVFRAASAVDTEYAAFAAAEVERLREETIALKAEAGRETRAVERLKADLKAAQRGARRADELRTDTATRCARAVERANRTKEIVNEVLGSFERMKYGGWLAAATDGTMAAWQRRLDGPAK
jgi:hypothetical protein